MHFIGYDKGHLHLCARHLCASRSILGFEIENTLICPCHSLKILNAVGQFPASTVLDAKGYCPIANLNMLLCVAVMVQSIV